MPESNVAATTGSYGSTDWSPRRGVQTYKEVYGEEKHPHDGLRLRDVLEQLGDEIREAQAVALKDGKPDLMKIKDCSVELGLTWEAKGTAGVEFWVFKLGGEASRSNTQTITLTLEPIGDVAVFLDTPRGIRLDDLRESVVLKEEPSGN
jgi:hypothetical protein